MAKKLPRKKGPTRAKRSSDVASLLTDAPTEFTKRHVFMLVYGDTGTGRTTFALTAPGPILLMHSAEKIDGVVEPFAREKEIKLFNFGEVYPPEATGDQVKAAAAAKWSQMKAVWVHGLENFRTVIIDTETDAWELVRNAYFGDVKPTGGRLEQNWGPVNADWKSMFKQFKSQTGANLIVISQTEDEYKENDKGFSNKTGRTVRKGQKSIPFMVDVAVRTDTKERRRDTVYRSTIEKPWGNGPLKGESYEDQLSTFPVVMSEITESDVDEWE